MRAATPAWMTWWISTSWDRACARTRDAGRMDGSSNPPNSHRFEGFADRFRSTSVGGSMDPLHILELAMASIRSVVAFLLLVLFGSFVVGVAPAAAAANSSPSSFSTDRCEDNGDEDEDGDEDGDEERRRREQFDHHHHDHHHQQHHRPPRPPRHPPAIRRRLSRARLGRSRALCRPLRPANLPITALQAAAAGEPPITALQAAAAGEPPITALQAAAAGEPPITALQAAAAGEPPITALQAAAAGEPPITALQAAQAQIQSALSSLSSFGGLSAVSGGSACLGSSRGHAGLCWARWSQRSSAGLLSSVLTSDNGRQRRRPRRRQRG